MNHGSGQIDPSIQFPFMSRDRDFQVFEPGFDLFASWGQGSQRLAGMDACEYTRNNSPRSVRSRLTMGEV